MKKEILKIITKMQLEVDSLNELGEDENSTSWNYEEGLLLSLNEAQLLVDFIKQRI